MRLLYEEQYHKGFSDGHAGRGFEPPLSGAINKAYYLAGFNSGRGESPLHQASDQQKAIINHAIGANQ